MPPGGRFVFVGMVKIDIWILRCLIDQAGCSSKDAAKQVTPVPPHKDLLVRFASVLIHRTFANDWGSSRLTKNWPEAKLQIQVTAAHFVTRSSTDRPIMTPIKVDGSRTAVVTLTKDTSHKQESRTLRKDIL